MDNVAFLGCLLKVAPLVGCCGVLRLYGQMVQGFDGWSGMCKILDE